MAYGQTQERLPQAQKFHKISPAEAQIPPVEGGSHGSSTEVESQTGNENAARLLPEVTENCLGNPDPVQDGESSEATQGHNCQEGGC